jgi:hypothetical protein
MEQLERGHGQGKIFNLIGPIYGFKMDGLGQFGRFFRIRGPVFDPAQGLFDPVPLFPDNPGNLLLIESPGNDHFQTGARRDFENDSPGFRTFSNGKGRKIGHSLPVSVYLRQRTKKGKRQAWHTCLPGIYYWFLPG